MATRRKPGEGRGDAGALGTPKAPNGPRRPASPAAASPRRPSAGAARPVSSLVIASFLGREAEWADPETGEIGRAPVSVGCIEYPDGGGELYGVATGRGGKPQSGEYSEIALRHREEHTKGPVKAAELARERQVKRAERSEAECARRARSRVRRLCRQYGLDHMVTLTFPGEGVKAYDRALRLLQDFIHDHGAVLHLEGAWLAVPELHPGGHGWHWHVLMSRRFKKPELLALRVGWTEFLRRRGMVPSGGAEYARIDVKAWKDAARAAAYAAKYAGKGFEGDDRQKGRKRYLIPRGLDVPVLRGGANSLDEVRAVIRQIDTDTVFESSEAEDWRGPPMAWSSWSERGARGRPHERQVGSCPQMGEDREP